MKKKQFYIIILVLAAGSGAWFAYKHFFSKEPEVIAAQQVSVQSYSPNSCWIYHEYVYRVDFSEQSLSPFFFIMNSDGSFSPTLADSSGNHIYGNGFIIDSTGTCVTNEKITKPWKLTEEDQVPLKELVDAWLELKENIFNKDYHISGQTVALFVVLNDPKDFIEYSTSAPVPGQQDYSIIYPLQKTVFKGIKYDFGFSAGIVPENSTVLQILKTTFNEDDPQKTLVKTSIDSIQVTWPAEVYFENIKVLAGDEFFNDGSFVFDVQGKLLGNLYYENKKWKLMPISSFIQNPPAYNETEIREKWEYDVNTHAWKRIQKTGNVAETITSGETYKPGPLESTIKVYPSPTPK